MGIQFEDVEREIEKELKMRNMDKLSEMCQWVDGDCGNCPLDHLCNLGVEEMK